MKTCGSGGIAPPFLTQALDGGEWSDLRLGRFTPGERVPRTHFIADREVCNLQFFSWSGFIPTSGFLSTEPRCWVISNIACRDSAVGIATGYGLDGRGVGVRVPVGERFFSPPRPPDRLRGPPSLLSNGYWGLLSPGVKRPGREADHLPPTIAEVKNTCIYTCLHGIVLN
jgi:hypothetical protein